MDFEQVLHKASVVCLIGGRRSKDHFVAVTAMIPHKKTECEMCRSDTSVSWDRNVGIGDTILSSRPR